jgi:hypothetical protein
MPTASIQIEYDKEEESRDIHPSRCVPKPDVFGPSDAVLSSHDNESAQDQPRHRELPIMGIIGSYRTLHSPLEHIKKNQ